MISSKISPVWRETWQCLYPLAIVAILLGSIFILSQAYTLSGDACAYATVLSQSTTVFSNLACFEFYLNRYQTLVGIAGALVAAAIAASPVWRQVKLSGMQAALQLQPVIEKMEQEIGGDFALLELVGQIEKKLSTLEFLAGVATEEGVDSTIASHIQKNMLDTDEQIDLISEGKLQHFVARLRLSPETRLLRSSLMESLLLTRKVLHRPVPSPTKSSQEMIDEKFCKRLEDRLIQLNAEISTTTLKSGFLLNSSKSSCDGVRQMYSAHCPDSRNAPSSKLNLSSIETIALPPVSAAESRIHVSRARCSAQLFAKRCFAEPGPRFSWSPK
jgi:hypothetical protein